MPFVSQLSAWSVKNAAEQRETDRIEAAARRAWRHGVAGARWEAIAGSADGLAMHLAFLAVLGIGGARESPPEIEAASQFQERAASIARITRVNQLSTESLSPPGPVTSRPKGPVDLRFENVSFRYQPSLPLLYEQVSFTVPAGGLTAVVGPSGSGKSTVLPVSSAPLRAVERQDVVVASGFGNRRGGCRRLYS